MSHEQALTKLRSRYRCRVQDPTGTATARSILQIRLDTLDELERLAESIKNGDA